jgi:hypothetical protein
MASEEEKLSTALKKVLPEAELGLDMRSLLSTLDSKDLLNPYEYQDVNSEPNRIEQTRKVFNYIRGKGPDYQEKFVKVLEQQGRGTEHWAKKIRELAGASVESSGENSNSSDNTPEPEEPRNRLEDKPTSLEVLDGIVPKVAPNWETLSVRLGVEDEGKQIEKDHAKVKDRCYQVIKAWLDGKGLKPVTWEFLLKAARKEGFEDLANDIEKKLEQGQRLD